MASVPNMRLGPAPQPGVAGQAAEGVEADLFAQLLSVLPSGEGAQQLAATDLEGLAAPVEEKAAGEDEAAALLGLVSFELPAPSPQAEALPGAEAPILAGPMLAPVAAVPPTALASAEIQDPASPAAPIAANISALPVSALPPASRPVRSSDAGAAIGVIGPEPAKAGPAGEPAPSPIAADASPEAKTKAAPLAEKAPLTEQKIVAMLRGLSSPTGAPQRARTGEASSTPAAAAFTSTAEASAPQQPAPPAGLAAPFVPLQPAAPVEQAAPLQPDAADEMVERQLDLAADGEWLDSLTRDIVRSGGSEGPMRFRLNPEHLGALRVEVMQGDNGATIRLTADTEAARAILAEAQPKLLAEARAQGLRVSDTQVDLSGGNAGDPRRHEEARRDPIFRTARALGGETDPVEQPTRGTSDRYA